MSLPIALDYGVWLADLKARIAGARARAVLAANAEQIALYHELGREILARQGREGWGAKVIDRLSADLRAAFPDMKGLSTRNLMYMRDFARAYPDPAIVQRLAAQLPWFHIVTLLTQVPDPAVRTWYADRTISEAWSRDMLIGQIRSQLHLRQGTALTNFAERLPAAQSGLAAAVLKDPYHFDFLGLGEEAHERDIEAALVRHITRFLLELGQGFAFLGRQVRLEVEGDEFLIDLLFYLLAPIEEPQARLQANQTWKRQVFDLISWGGEAEPERDANCIKAWPTTRPWPCLPAPMPAWRRT